MTGFKQKAMARTADRAADVLRIAGQAGVDPAVLFVAFASAIGGQDPRRTRLSLDALEDSLLRGSVKATTTP
ncbi:hypothetical protein RA307_04790 [Xanthobacteraceae bacterium Astr-EGSB]|uniref:hypothetical protein n=1 Tax=Astrobacterium formosum TaxID=3069710 RepID=UPI0027B06D76|nr:hypothetical protein [Xanthobacteraceae bacterium Astr-EGSB]